jgi:hypothetical protein
VARRVQLERANAVLLSAPPDDLPPQMRSKSDVTIRHGSGGEEGDEGQATQRRRDHLQAS